VSSERYLYYFELMRFAGCQNLRYTLIDLDGYGILQESRIPLPRKTTLTWLGYTPEGAPAMYDSSGLLSVLDRFRQPGQARWVPYVDTNLLARREGKMESYWPVGVGGGKLACVILKVGPSIHWRFYAEGVIGCGEATLVPSTHCPGIGGQYAITGPG
jgi:hypothetical protein